MQSQVQVRLSMQGNSKRVSTSLTGKPQMKHRSSLSGIRPTTTCESERISWKLVIGSSLKR